MSLPLLPFWKKTPFFRLLLPFITGICLQWYTGLSAWVPATGFILSLSFILLYHFSGIGSKFRMTAGCGLMVFVLFLSSGAILSWLQDIRHTKSWYGHFADQAKAYYAVLDENPIEKTNSFKANASIISVQVNNSWVATKGGVIIYFQKDTVARRLKAGSLLVFNRSVQEITNSGNPGAFDYKRYALFQQITHQVNLAPASFVVTGNTLSWLKSFLIRIREQVICILEKYIPGQTEKGLAEALLIGFKDNLDKPLVQSYTNTGVVHIIAISGLHLGLIYWLLNQCLKPMARRKKLKWLQPVIIIAGLWLFSLVAGAQPSVLRSALMFSIFVISKSINRNSSIINSLCLSAFVLLCIDPFWLWDVGFQLSYIAVLSIVLFMRPIYNWFVFQNKVISFFWKLTAVTLAAQVLTVPLSIYHFHQFPVYFLLSNFWAVPLSSLILLLELLLCTIFFFAPIAKAVGWLTGWLIGFMNEYIKWIEKLPLATWDGFQISWLQWWLLIAAISCFCYWLLEKSKSMLVAGMVSSLIFLVLRNFSFFESSRRQQIIVYNTPKKTAIDFVNGRDYVFMGDSELTTDGFERNFHLKPARILMRTRPAETIQGLHSAAPFFMFGNKKIAWLNGSVQPALAAKDSIDLLILSGNPKIYFRSLQQHWQIRQAVFTASSPPWKIKLWKQDCDSLGIPWHDVRTDGAFIIKTL